MAWTTPRCWTTGEVVTATLLNQQIKGNLEVTSAGVVSAAGDITYASAANTMARVGKGSNGNILHQASCAPAWTACPSIAGITLSGALDANGTVDADVTDFDVLSSGDIDLVSSANAAAAVYIAQSTGTSGTIKIHADTGTSVTEGAESVNILSDVGGVGIRSTANLANAINITNDGGTTGTITIFQDQGTSVTEGAASIEILSDAGGVELRSTANLANAINITNDGGTTGTITVFNDQGTSVTEGAASIELLSDAGGVELRSTANLANAIALTSDGGTTGSILIFNDQGTTATEGSSSIQLLSDVGAVGIKSGLNAAGAIRLTADAGTSETIILHAAQGSGVGSICLTSDAGGITLNPGTFVTVGANATNAAEIRMFEDTDHGCNYVAIKAPNVSTSYTMTLPTAVAGGNCYVLQSTNAGVLSWAAASAGAVSALNNATANELVTIGGTTTELCAEANLTFDGTTLTVANASCRQVLVPNGAVAKPAIAAAADTNTGLYFPSAETLALSSGGVELVRYECPGRIFVRDTANGGLTVGLTLNQLANDNQILALKSSDTCHSFTSKVEADTFAGFYKMCGNNGGLRIESYNGNNSPTLSMLFKGYAYDSNTAKNAGGNAPVEIRAAVRCSTGVQSTVNMAMFSVAREDNGNVLFMVDLEGDYFYYGSGTAFDEQCDVGLVRAFSTTMAQANCSKGIIRSKWDDHVKANEKELVELGVLGDYVNCVPSCKVGLVNGPQLQRLHNGAIWQLHTRLADQGEEIKELQGQLKALNGGK